MKKEIIWKGVSFSYKSKGFSWFFFVSLFFFLIFLFALWQNNFLFALFIVLAGIMTIVLAKKKPKLLEFKLNDQGITIGDKTYLFKDLEGFYINEEKKPELFLKRKIPFLNFKIPIRNKDLSEIKEFLKQRLPEEKIEDSLIDIFIKKIGF